MSCRRASSSRVSSRCQPAQRALAHHWHPPTVTVTVTVAATATPRRRTHQGHRRHCTGNSSAQLEKQSPLAGRRREGWPLCPVGSRACTRLACAYCSAVIIYTFTNTTNCLSRSARKRWCWRGVGIPPRCLWPPSHQQPACAWRETGTLLSGVWLPGSEAFLWRWRLVYAASSSLEIDFDRLPASFACPCREALVVQSQTTG